MRTRLKRWRRSVGSAAVSLCAAAGLGGALATPAAAAAGPSPVTSYTYTSVAGDYIGQGKAGTYREPTAKITLTGDAGAVRVRVQGAEDLWDIDIAAPKGEQLRPGVYRNAERAAFRTGRSPGLDVGGNGRGCNEVYGQFSIAQIATDASGAVTLLDASYTQKCESATAQPLKGTVKYRALPLSYTYKSDAGDWVGQGKSVTHTGATSTFRLSDSYGGGVSFGVEGKREYWTAEFRPPTGERLTAGRTYQVTGAEGGATLEVYGNGRACGNATGEFSVDRLYFTEEGKVTGLSVRYRQVCGGGTAGMSGTVHYAA
ncbi:hypothetical protein [Streptomyces paromomycinus]|uniref:Uncharacterized protein n=1 Tax=Streptomyces paromomycinus TaxID=92743 RepID=A0A401W655_STREY|nr:hypothetical protein [Streptomyces paromomycinus]GCD44772.1 hypothetical protein GKJPGBOP_04486 [Streptomyces paromomycinus]